MGCKPLIAKAAGGDGLRWQVCSPRQQPLPLQNAECLCLTFRYVHKKLEMADVDTADIGPHLAAAYEFIETAVAGKKGEAGQGQGLGQGVTWANQAELLCEPRLQRVAGAVAWSS